MNVEFSSPEQHPPVEFVPPPGASRGRPWGLWATCGFTLLLLVAHLAIAIVVIAGYIVATQLGPNPPRFNELVDRIPQDGNVVSIIALLSAVFIPAGCLLFAWLRRGMPVKEYLALHGVSATQSVGWILLALAVPVALDQMFAEEAPEFMVNVYESVTWKPLLWLAVVVGAPVWEEFVFRGFLFAGLRNTALGATGTLVATSFAFGCLHLGQYDAVGVFSTMLVGFVLGIARLRTESLFVPILMHGVYNSVAMVQLVDALENAKPALLLLLEF